MASDYAFGTKVSSQDNDLGRPLKNMPDGTIISFWDIGTNLGIYDAGDVVYLDTPPIGIVNANDIRLTPLGDHRAGTKVRPNDEDMNAPLKPLPAEIRFLNLNGSQSYEIHDPLYIHQPNDINLSDIKTENVNDPIVYPAAADPSISYSSTAANIANADSTNLTYPANATTSNIAYPTANAAKTYETSSGETAPSENQDSPIAKEGFWVRLSYTGYCDNLPQGTTCLIYSDSFIWPVSDYRIDNTPSLVGLDNNGRPIEVIRCNNADYYHILGTLFVKSVPKQKTLVIQSASSQNVPNMGNNPENIRETGGYDINKEGVNKLIDALSRVNANSDSIRTNDVRLTFVQGLESGTKVRNFDIDLSKVVALPVLVSFPRKSDDYACIRVYDANGNGLYDSPDDVYLDVSFPGSSSFGIVSINNVRLSSPAA